MFQSSAPGAAASTVSPAHAPEPEYEIVRHLLFGTYAAVQLTIKELHVKRYAEPNDWSQPISTGRPNEVMTILTKRVRVG
ncbi:MAG: hypothetical protein AAFQ89_17575 [Cyanobacteria bacterium J06626_18]